MTEQEVNEVFSRHFKGGDLNEETIASIDEISASILKRVVGDNKKMEVILNIIMKVQNRLNLFIWEGSRSPVHIAHKYIAHVDFIRDSMVQICSYTIDNYESMNVWFKEKFFPQDLVKIKKTLSESEYLKMMSNLRLVMTEEMNIYNELIKFVMIGILGIDACREFSIEYDASAIILNRCQREAEQLKQLDTSGHKPS